MAIDEYDRAFELLFRRIDEGWRHGDLDAAVAWLDAVPVQASRRDGVIYRYQVCQAFATVVGRDELTWNVATLASDVEPVAGAQLVDGLRALRESRRGCHRRMRWPR
jgi:hypothetical protein